MSKKLYGLISGLIGVTVTTAEILLAYFQPDKWGLYMAAAGIAAKAADEILLLFVDKTTKTKN